MAMVLPFTLLRNRINSFPAEPQDQLLKSNTHNPLTNRLKNNH